jgi:hypothetical protein
MFASSDRTVFRPIFSLKALSFILGSGLLFLAVYWTFQLHAGVGLIPYKGLSSEVQIIIIFLLGSFLCIKAFYGFTEITLESSGVCIKRLLSSKRFIPYKNIQEVVIADSREWVRGSSGIKVTIKHTEGTNSIDFLIIERKEYRQLLEEIEKCTGKKLSINTLNW